MWEYHDGGWWIVMWLSMAIFWGLLIIGVLTLANWFTKGETRGDSAEDILSRRLAVGEIDQEQYRALRDELRHRSYGTPRTSPH